MIKNQNFSQNNLLTLIFVLLASTTVSSQFLKTSGKDIIDKNSNPIILRGLGLGGWMLQEPYMMKVSVHLLSLAHFALIFVSSLQLHSLSYIGQIFFYMCHIS